LIGRNSVCLFRMGLLGYALQDRLVDLRGDPKRIFGFPYLRKLGLTRITEGPGILTERYGFIYDRQQVSIYLQTRLSDFFKMVCLAKRPIMKCEKGFE
jgi:hypothetical protein